MTGRNTKRALALIAVVFGLVTMLIAKAKAQSDPQSQSALTAPQEPLRPGVGADQLFAELDAHNELRKSALQDYTAVRIYQVIDTKGKVHAEEVGRMEFRA
jgi:hypothetical protein